VVPALVALVLLVGRGAQDAVLVALRVLVVVVVILVIVRVLVLVVVGRVVALLFRGGRPARAERAEPRGFHARLGILLVLVGVTIALAPAQPVDERLQVRRGQEAERHQRADRA